MSAPKTSEEVMRDLNDLAKRLGRYPAKSIWDTPPAPGSILDVPVTPESEARSRRLDALIARLEEQNAAAAAMKEGGASQCQGVTAPATDVIAMPPTAVPE